MHPGVHPRNGDVPAELASVKPTQAGLALVDALTAEASLQAYHLLSSVRGDLLFKLGRFEEARIEFEGAAALTATSANAICSWSAPEPRRGLKGNSFPLRNVLASGIISGSPTLGLAPSEVMAADSPFDDLMRRLRAGDQAAAATLFNRFTNRLIGLARLRLDARLRQKVDPEDVLQSVWKSFFLRHAEGQFALDNWDNLWSLLTVITGARTRPWRDRFRAAGRDVAREAAAGPAESGLSWEALARDPTPAEVLMLTETVEHLMGGVNEADREIVSLSLQGYTVAEIVEQTGRAQRSVYRVLEQVKTRLQS